MPPPSVSCSKLTLQCVLKMGIVFPCSFIPSPWRVYIPPPLGLSFVREIQFCFSVTIHEGLGLPACFFQQLPPQQHWPFFSCRIPSSRCIIAIFWELSSCRWETPPFRNFFPSIDCLVNILPSSILIWKHFSPAMKRPIIVPLPYQSAPDRVPTSKISFLSPSGILIYYPFPLPLPNTVGAAPFSSPQSFACFS